MNVQYNRLLTNKNETIVCNSKLITIFALQIEEYIIKNFMEKVTSEVKKTIFAEYGSSETDSGSVGSQVALFTARIKYLTEHVKKNKKDFSNTKALTTMVAKRRNLLKYLANKDIVAYRELIAKLGLRR